MTFDEFAIKVFGANFPNDATLAEFARSPDIHKAVTFWVIAKCQDSGIELEREIGIEALPAVSRYRESVFAHAANATQSLVDLVRLKLKAANDPFEGGRF